MKVYFACSIRGGGDTSNYQNIIDSIKRNGGEVLSEVFANDALRVGGSPLPVDDIYRRDISWIDEADVIIAEVTNPSHGVGYELGYAENSNKPVLALFDGSSSKKLSAMVAGNPHIHVATYQNGSDIDTAVKKFLTI